jgi:hypothetical protein
LNLHRFAFLDGGGAGWSYIRTHRRAFLAARKAAAKLVNFTIAITAAASVGAAPISGVARL